MWQRRDLLICALLAVPLSARAVPLLILNETAAENLGSVTFDAAGDGANPVVIAVQIGGTATAGIPGLTLSAGQLGLYIQPTEGGPFQYLPPGNPCAGTTNGSNPGDCVVFSVNATSGLVQVSGFLSDPRDAPDPANTDSFSVGPAGAPVLNVQIVSNAETLAPEPSGLAVLASGLGWLGWRRRRSGG